MNVVPPAVLAVDFARAARSASKQARGIMARHLDVAAVAAKADARAKWGAGPSASSIRARMSRSIGARGGSTQVGYLMVDGGGAFQETGTGHHPPNPVLGPAVESITDALASDLADIVDPF